MFVKGKGLTLAMSREEVRARLGNEECDVKTLDNTHLYCEPPEVQPLALDDDDLPRLKVGAVFLDSCVIVSFGGSLCTADLVG